MSLSEWKVTETLDITYFTNGTYGLAPTDRRSNLRLAFPGQGCANSDRPHNNLEFPASGYPQMYVPTLQSFSYLA